MPIYEYKCKQCDRHFEYQQAMSEPAKTTCEACGGALERLISASAFVLKGGGWYKDLYSSSKKDGGAKADSGKAESKTGGESKGSESGSSSTSPSPSTTTSTSTSTTKPGGKE
jgi:putative FmdB family regulatory protein